jgi:hypothetical protein
MGCVLLVVHAYLSVNTFPFVTGFHFFLLGDGLALEMKIKFQPDYHKLNKWKNDRFIFGRKC